MASNTIWLKGEGQIKEAAAGAAITPGHLIVRNSANAFVVHPTAEGNVYPMFALEKDFVGKDISVAYSSTERVQAVIPLPGAEIYALLPASALAVVIGDELVSNGDGTLKKVTAGAVTVSNLRRVCARALEAVDNSAGGSPVRIKVETV
jgi:hypothetical protein